LFLILGVEKRYIKFSRHGQLGFEGQAGSSTGRHLRFLVKEENGRNGSDIDKDRILHK
jgi:hypothetical protein